MDVTLITKKSWILSNISKDTYKKDIYDFIKSLDCCCHVANFSWKPTTPITCECTIEEDF